jgi:hypothetical protein
VTQPVADFTPLLRAALDEARAAGLVAESDALESRVFACYTTSSELLGETGIAIKSFLAVNRSRLQPSTVRKLEQCLREIGKAWPKFRPWFSWSRDRTEGLD